MRVSSADRCKASEIKAGTEFLPISNAARVEPLETFFKAEDYHQDYAERNPGQPYIAFNAMPKLEKLHENFADRIKDE